MNARSEPVLFLRKQLALFQEREIKPRRADDATRVAMVWLSRTLNWREAARHRPAGDSDSLASEGLSALLEAQVPAGPAGVAPRDTSLDSPDGIGEPDLGRRAHRARTIA
jgi:hypothetical protein